MDAARFKIVIENSRSAMMSRASAIIGNQEEAQELVQDVCVKLWENSSGLASADNPNAYCIRAVHNAAISAARRRWRNEPLDEIKNEPATEPATDASDEVNYITQLIGMLPDNQRIAFLLRQEGLEFETIAKRMGLKHDNVRQLISRARKKLRELYAQDY